MSISKRWLAVKANREAVVALYRSPSLPTQETIAQTLGVTYATVTAALRQEMSREDLKALAVLRYSASKTGSKNPMQGKVGKKHHRWKGLCEDGNGYLTILWHGKRHFAHHVVMMEALGLEKLPPSMAVHHIDGDKQNNELDNLALTTRQGHQQIHFLQVKDSLGVQLKRSSIADAVRLLTSK